MTKAVKITLAITIPLVFIIGFLCLAWIYSPTEFTIIFQIENETLETLNNLTGVIEQNSPSFVGQGPSNFFNQTLLNDAENILE